MGSSDKLPSVPNGIVLFNYPVSPFGRRAEHRSRLCCYQEQPFILPRPDLEKLGLKYCRIPIFAIGRDIYLDTRLILRKLEEKFPDGRLGNDKLEDRFVEKLLENAGRGSSRVLGVRENMFEFFETTMLADGRKWALKTEKPSLADIEAIWPLDWLVSLERSMPPHFVPEERFPKVYAWIARVRATLDEAKSSAPKTGGVDSGDPLGIGAGTQIEIYPADWGSEHRDSGQLVALVLDEVTVAARSRDGAELRIHAPRTGFRITEIGRRAAGSSN
ncbi:hypothetical protein K458DRAFT_479280 [Lentithecium fluviatile CBS 122367]|uniref:DUF7962 domain-containing protein n=1 Tax=Lentithecium fluviatile CBS 122367 TaxID=1168545 RepID=A0A6G1IUF6_9PLEO|nr:hypothetical protein K458DRAFT_479280 [Lentithecium fluviatile CBS 122367]